MKYIFFGSGDFSVIVLHALLRAGLSPLAVVCNPDRPVGRKKIITAPAIKLLADEHHIPVLQPDRLSVEDFSSITNVDCFVIAAYAQIIPESILQIPRCGAVGVHPSFLPRYRGATPIQSVILAGEEETGVSLFLVDSQVDHGPLIATSAAVPVLKGYYKDLEAELALVAGELLVDVLPRFVAGDITPVPQNESLATKTKKIKTNDAFVSFDDLHDAMNGDLKKASLIERTIRAFTPEPGVWTVVENAVFGTTTVQNKRVKLLEAIVTPQGLVLLYIQIEGKQPMRI
jgi:methionyl-tRNA formyltransferase